MQSSCFVTVYIQAKTASCGVQTGSVYIQNYTKSEWQAGSPGRPRTT